MEESSVAGASVAGASVAGASVAGASVADITNIFYINLSERNDRRIHIESELNKVGFTKYERFNAVKMPNGDGRIGCSMSHLKCLELAKERGYNHILICEDDTTFLNPELFKKQLNHCLTTMHNKWDVILLAGNNVPPYTLINDACIKVTRCQTTTIYLVNGNYFDRLIENIKEGIKCLMKEPTRHIDFAVDKYWLKLQYKDMWLLITPPTVIQREDYSDIEKRNTNYSQLMLDIDKAYMFNVAPPSSKNNMQRMFYK